MRALCDRYGIVPVFDEVVTGFRLAYGGAQEAYGVTPDLCTLGKVIGGGFPLAAVAGLKTMEILRREGAYATLAGNGERVMAMLRRHLDPTGLPYRIVGHPTLFEVVFADREVRDYRDVLAADAARAARFNAVLRAEGVFKSPGKTYPCLALEEADFELTEAAVVMSTETIA